MEDKKVEDKPDKEDSLEDREKEYSRQSKIQEQLGNIYTQVVAAFGDKQDYNVMVEQCWNCFNCNLDDEQQYSGTSEIYVPIIHDALEARETRFINMLFPKSGRYADITTDDGTVPYDLIALLDYYSRTTSLRTSVIPAMIRAGDITGQYSLYLSWKKTTRNIVIKKMSSDTEETLGTVSDAAEKFEDREYTEEIEGMPKVTVLDNRNLVILPATVDDIQDADIVAIVLRLSKSELRGMIEDETLDKEAAEDLIEAMTSNNPQIIDTGKKSVAQTTVKIEGSKGNKRVLVYQIWSKLKIGSERRLMISYMATESRILGCKRCPYWCDRIPVISQPVEKMSDSIWGVSPVNNVRPMQYAANDAVNMGFDSAQYSLMPIVMTNPESNPKLGSMVMSQAAIWETSPKDTQFVTMPQIWKDALSIVAQVKEQIMTSLGVNPAMMPNANASKKPTQAQIAQEQAVMLESVADNISILKEGIMDKILRWFYDLDYQFRDKGVTVRQFGKIGLDADLQQVEPQQEYKRLFIQWYGFEQAKSAADVQQMVSWVNVLKGLPPEALNGRKLDIGPIIDYATQTICGPHLGPKTLVDQRHMYTMDPIQENELMNHNFPVQVNPGDDDQKHLVSHTQDFQVTGGDIGDSNQYKRNHILAHMQQMQKKSMMAAGQQQQNQSQPVAGGPRPGAQTQMPTGPQQPAGAIHQDQMPLGAPRDRSGLT